MIEGTVTLLQFPYSPYNEKARWALDYKRVAHRRRSFLPGPHKLKIRRLTGQSGLPVVLFDGVPVHGSARIIDELERRFADPALYPEDDGLRRRALEIQAWFDDEVGPKVRCASLAAMIGEADYLCDLFTASRGAAVRRLYRATFPLARGLIAKSNGITGAEAIEDGIAMTARALKFVVEEAGRDGFLVGNAFSIADLAAAAILAPAANPPGSPMARPEPMPASVQGYLQRWADNPGTAWVQDQYRRHRPPSAETAPNRNVLRTSAYRSRGPEAGR